MQRRWFSSAVLMAMALLVATSACAQKQKTREALKPAATKLAIGDWPWWRGPDRNGISRETKWSTDWPAGGPKQLWRVSIGTGFSSMAVVRDKLYTMGHSGGSDTVFCLDAERGNEIWKYSYPCKLVDNLHEGGPAATPTVDGDRLYTISKEGHLFCFDANTSDVIWKAEFQPLFGVRMPEWGFSASAVVLGEKLIVDAGRLVAFNKMTGEVIWKTEPQRPGYGTPTRFTHDGEALIAWIGNDALVVVRALDGSLVDQAPWQTDFATSACTPIVHEGAIFISTGYNRGCALFDLKGGRLAQRYENKAMRNHMAASVLWQGHLYGFDGNSHNASSVHLKCIEFATGKEKWKHRGLGCGTLMMAGERLIVLSDQGELVIAPVSAEGFGPIARAQVLEGRCWTVPVLSRGRLYCRDAAGDLVCVALR
jgi:outer membrane protein assembly factor BamB